LSDDLKTLSLSHLDSLVIDEADLILSYGHDEDIRSIFAGTFLPKVYQSFLMSATMTDDVETLKGLALRNPVRLCPISTLGILVLMHQVKVTLNLEEDEDEAANLVQYVVRYLLFSMLSFDPPYDLHEGQRRRTSSC
jgi:ATP-dependent RNA helicase DDX56/DBP9